MMEERQLEHMLQNQTIIQSLNSELSEIIDIKDLNYQIKYTPYENFTIDKDFNINKHTPEVDYALHGNIDSKFFKHQPNAFSITTMLRGRKDQTAYYLSTLGHVGTQVLFIQPFINGNNLTIFKEAPSGGWHLRTAVIKDIDLRRIP